MRRPSQGILPRARRPLATIAVAVAALGAAACSPAPSATVAAAVELTVSGAASLTGALEEIVPAYALHAPGVTLTISTGASSALRTQIEQGAAADVFLSADTQQPTALVDGGLAAGDQRIFASNELTVIKPVDAEKVVEPADMADPGVKIIAAGDAVPITKYANQVVANLSTLPGYPAGFAEAYAANIVSREDDVKAVVAKIELGEGDAAIVYGTDARAADAVAVMRIPDAANVVASYAGVAVKASTHPAEAAAFLDWLTGSEGQAILAAHGFLPPAP
jgi:molybdate transport system substrate-binding protein